MKDLPPPGTPCPNCGNHIPAGFPYCSVCGYGIQRASGPPASNTGAYLFAIIFAVIGVPAGLCGGCFLLIGGAEGALFGIAGLAVFGLLLWIVLAHNKRMD